MIVDPDTFLISVYALVDQICQDIPPLEVPHPGPTPRMTESEVLSLMILSQYLGKSERGVLRWAASRTIPLFRQLLSQSAFNRRARVLATRMNQLLPAVAAKLDLTGATYEIVDGLPVPLALRSRGDRHRLFLPEEAAVGRGGVGKPWYYGVSLLLCTSPDGVITGYTTAPANTGERWQFSALLSWREDPTVVPHVAAALATHNAKPKTYLGSTETVHSPTTVGQTLTGCYLADRGFTGATWKTTWEDLHANVITPEHLQPVQRHAFSHARQLIETVNGVLTEVLHIKRLRARTPSGLATRIATVCAAFNIGMLINRELGREDLAHGTLCNA